MHTTARAPGSTTSGSPAPPLIFIGADVAQLSRALASGPEASVVVFAPDQTSARDFRAACSTIDAIDAAGRLSVLVGPDYAGASQVAARCAGLAGARVLIDTQLEMQRPADVARARAALTKLTFQSSANDGARRASAGRYVLHTLTNAPRLAREADVGALTAVLADLPTVIVAAGPSLDRNIRDLALMQDRVVIIACDTAARPLLMAGIDPHFIVATDSSQANATHLMGLPPTRAWLVAEGSLHPSAFAHFEQHTFVFRVADHQPWPWLQSLGVDGTKLDTWGSVATCAFSLALLLGSAPIAFVGADFAFTDGRPYCRGTSFEPQWASWHRQGSTYDDIWRLLRDRWSTVTTETGVDGHAVETAPHLISFRDWLAERAAAHADRRVINATGAGLLMGTAIEQETLTSAFAHVNTIDRALLHQVIAAAHHGARGDMSRLLAGIGALVDGDTLAAWLDFGAGSLSVATITSALRSPEYAAWMLAHQHHRR